MATVTGITLPADVSAYIQTALSSGKYQSVDDLVAAALRAQRDREQKLAEVRAKIDEGLEDFARGDFIEIKDEAAHRALFDELKAERL
jgi:putative addiction module CopG family antidote